MNNQQNPDMQYQDKNNKNKKKGTKSPMDRASEAMKQLRNISQGSIPSDTMGSYTGTSYDGGEPEQDADDL